MSIDLFSGKWIDVTRPLMPGMSRWPGDPGVELDPVSDMRRGDVCNVSKLSMCTHSGTHIDAPLHFLSDGVGADQAPLEVFMGVTRVIAIDDPVSIRRAELEQHKIEPGQRILFKTCNRNISWESDFQMDFVYVAADAARYLAEKKVILVGIDGMSVGGFYHDMVETHITLLKAGVWIVENVDLREIEPGLWDMICLPVKLVAGDGAPARVLLKKHAD